MKKIIMFNATTGETRAVEKVIPLVDDWYYVGESWEELYDIKHNLVGYVRESFREGHAFKEAILCEDDEVYLTEEAVNGAECADKATMARDLVKRLIDNQQGRDSEAEAALVRCLIILHQVSPTTTITRQPAR